ncbi:MAG: hypothetical protein B7733_22365 [Myxococcales bacterium FL481]|nr:MAG: hypothetical protein B7733_22365 [Myxococcales bacterium FL481]
MMARGELPPGGYIFTCRFLRRHWGCCPPPNRSSSECSGRCTGRPASISRSRPTRGGCWRLAIAGPVWPRTSLVNSRGCEGDGSLTSPPPAVDRVRPPAELRSTVMKLRTALTLARASNLPTVWTNVLVGVAIVGQPVPLSAIFGLLVGLSAMYCGGMFLNDACDLDFDRRERPERPLARGDVGLAEVWFAGLGLLVVGIVACGVVASDSGPGWLAGAGPAFLLAVTIVLYDVHHRHNRWAAWVMGSCRGLTYCVCARALGAPVDAELALAVAVIVIYVAGLTAVARFEVGRGRPSWRAKLGVWVPWLVYGPGLAFTFAGVFAGLGLVYLVDCLGDLTRRDRPVGATVARLVAAISLVDALLLASLGRYDWAWLAVAALPLCRRFQRRVPGT